MHIQKVGVGSDAEVFTKKLPTLASYELPRFLEEIVAKAKKNPSAQLQIEVSMKGCGHMISYQAIAWALTSMPLVTHWSSIYLKDCSAELANDVFAIMAEQHRGEKFVLHPPP